MKESTSEWIPDGVMQDDGLSWSQKSMLIEILDRMRRGDHQVDERQLARELSMSRSFAVAVIKGLNETRYIDIWQVGDRLIVEPGTKLKRMVDTESRHTRRKE